MARPTQSESLPSVCVGPRLRLLAQRALSCRSHFFRTNNRPLSAANKERPHDPPVEACVG
jgi:hypothetical protein